jgi:hypothetical protein
VDEAFLAATGDVTFLGAWVCDRALAAALFALAEVLELRSVADAFDAAFLPVSLLIRSPLLW